MKNAHGIADGSECEVLCLAFVRTDTPLLASAGNDRVVRCWRIRDNSCVSVVALEVKRHSFIHTPVVVILLCASKKGSVA